MFQLYIYIYVFFLNHASVNVSRVARVFAWVCARSLNTPQTTKRPEDTAGSGSSEERCHVFRVCVVLTIMYVRLRGVCLTNKNGWLAM